MGKLEEIREARRLKNPTDRLKAVAEVIKKYAKPIQNKLRNNDNKEG